MKLKKVLYLSMAGLMLTGIGATANNANAKRRHIRTKRVYRRHAKRHYRRARRHYSYGTRRNFRPSLKGGIHKFWVKNHYVKTAHQVRAYEMSDKGVDEANDYIVHSKIVPKGRILKGFYSPTTPGGFGITKGKGLQRPLYILGRKSCYGQWTPLCKASLQYLLDQQS